MFYTFDVESYGTTVRHIITRDESGAMVSFKDDPEDMTGPRAAYAEWVAEGNEPEPWPPAEA
jgi:hypothetical protein